MKTIKNLAFAALAALTVTLLLPTSPAVAGNSAPVQLTFFKEVVTWAGFPTVPFAGTFAGDLSGTLATTAVLSFGNSKQLVHLEAVYVFTADDGTTFTAHVEGNANTQTKKAVLNGVVTDGYLEGAQVQVRFDDNGDGTYTGVVRIMTGSED